MNEHWFLSIADAKQIIEAWRVGYNTVRPHRSLGQLTPAAYAPDTREQPTKSNGPSLSV